MLNAVNQNQFPVAMSIIDLMLASQSVQGLPDIQGGLSAVKTLMASAWEAVSEECEV